MAARPDQLDALAQQVYPSRHWSKDSGTSLGISRVFGITSIDRNGLVIPRYDGKLLTLGSDDEHQLVAWNQRVGEAPSESNWQLSAESVIRIMGNERDRRVNFDLEGVMWRGDKELKSTAEQAIMPGGILYRWSEHSGGQYAISMATLVIERAGFMSLYRYHGDHNETEGVLQRFI